MTSATSKTSANAFAPPVFTPARTGVLQRKCDCGQHTGGGECEECKKKKSDEKTSLDPLLQRSTINGAVANDRGRNDGVRNRVPSIVHEVLRSPGQPLDAASRTFFEPRFGQDFSQVRVHDGQRAAASAQAVGASAYTVGKNLVFASGKYDPNSSSGRKLLVHELTHAVQQGSSRRSWETDPADLQIGRPDDAFEQDASRNEQWIENASSEKGMRGELNFLGQGELIVRPRPVIPPRIQRDLDDPSRFSEIHKALFVSTPGGGAPLAWKNPGPGEEGTEARIVRLFKTELLDLLSKHPEKTGGDIPTETTKGDAETDVVASDQIIRARFPQISSPISQSTLKAAVDIISPQQTSDPDFVKQKLTNLLYTMTPEVAEYGLPESDPRFQKILTDLLADSDVGPSIRIIASRSGAFTTGEGASRKVFLHRGLEDAPRKEVLLHEIVHFYVHPEFKDWIAQSTAPRFYEEGFTEYLARLAMTKTQLATAKEYQDRFDKVKNEVAAKASDDDIARSYFRGEVWLLEGKTEVSKKALEEQTGLKSKVTQKEEREESTTSDGIAETVVPGSHYRFMNLGNEEAEPKREHKALFTEIQNKYLNGHPDVRCRFVGHASSPGTDAFNMALSLKRAQAFYQMARDAGVPDSQLIDADKPQHFGERKPTAPNEDVRGRAFNRRVELFLITSQPATGAVQQAPAFGAEHSHYRTNVAVHDVLRSPGQPLDSATLAHFEPRFGRDFSQVRVHLDARAAESARGMNALAYSTGGHLVFATGQYDAKSLPGRQLLAHELTHVAQQSHSPTADASASERAERQARENARRFHEPGPLPAFEAAPWNAVLRQGAQGGPNQSQSSMTRTQFEDVMKRKFRVSSIRTGTFADQRFGDMKESDWEAWPTSSSEAPYSLIMDGINRVVASMGGMPPVREIVFFKVAYDKDFSTPPSSGIDHVIKNPNNGASFSAGKLEIFEAVTKGNPMLNLQGQFKSPTKEQSVSRNIAHELGHSVVEEGLDQGAIRKGIDPDIIVDYKLAAGWLKGPLPNDPELLYDAGDTTVQAAIVNRTPLPPDKRIRKDNLSSPWKERPLTGYGTTNVAEDFSEAFMAYVNEPAVLKKFAPRRFAFIDSRKSRWSSRLVDPNQPAPSTTQQGGTAPGQNRGANLPLRKDFKKEMEKSLEDL